MQLLEIFARKQYSVCASVSAAFHMQPLRYRGEPSAKAYHSQQKPKKKGAACVLEEMHVCAKEKIRRSSRSQSDYHYVVKAILKGYSSATDILREKDRRENSKQYKK